MILVFRSGCPIASPPVTEIPDRVLRYSSASVYVGGFLSNKVPSCYQQIGMGEKPPLIRSRYLCFGSQSSELGPGTQYREMPLEPRGRPPTRVIQVPFAGINYNVLHRQQPDYVSSVDKSGFRVTHSRSKILSQDHDNDHLRAQAEALLPNTRRA